MDPVTIETAIKENIIIIKLPSHTTDLLQPLDKSCFRPLKLEWDKTLIKWQMENQRKLSKSEFADLLCETWNRGFKPATIISGFVSTGIYPVNRMKYPLSRFDPVKLAKYKQEKQNANQHQGMTNILQEPSQEHSNDSKSSETEVDGLNGGPCNNIPRKIHILENICLKQPNLEEKSIIQQAKEPNESLSPQIPEENPSLPGCSFESILLNKVKKTSASVAPRRKVDIRAKVVTTEEFLQGIKQKADERNAKENNKKKEKAIQNLKNVQK